VFNAVKRSLRSWLWRIPVADEVDEELDLHVEMRTRELAASGLDPRKARQLALQRLGNRTELRRTMLDLGRRRDRTLSFRLWLEELRTDTRFALRQLRRAPGFSLVAALTLALGIGANSASFALVDATLLRPLAFRNPDQLVTIWETTATLPRSSASPLNMRDWLSRGHVLESVAGFTPSIGGMAMTGKDGFAETISRQWVSAGLFDVLGVVPVRGRFFTHDDDVKRERVVVLSETAWRTRFNADESIVGRQLRLDGDAFTVTGIAPVSFQLAPGKSEIWAMRPTANLPEQARGSYFLQAVGRLKPGVTVAAAQTELTSLAGTLAAEWPQTNLGRGVAVELLHNALIGSNVRLTSILFFGVVGVVLVICCANIASLLLARATVRARELAVRSALGASRRRVVRQLLTESLVLALIGGALGGGVGWVILSTAPSILPADLLPPTVSLSFDARVAGFCAAAAVLVGLLFGIAPAWQATRQSTASAIGLDSRSTSGRGGRMRAWLVTAEVAIAVLLLCGAGLLVRTLLTIESFDRGYRAGSVLSLYVDPIGSRYPTPESLQQFYDDVEREVRSAPGVRDVAWTSSIPLGEMTDGNTFEIVGEPVDPGQRPATSYQAVSATYFSTLDLPIVEGRAFSNADTRTAQPVAIINEAFAHRYFRTGSPVGRQLALRSADALQNPPTIRTIVGVARQVKRRPHETEDLIQYYVPTMQNLSDDIYMVVRPASGDAGALTHGVRSAIGRIDREQLVNVQDVMTLADLETSVTAWHRFRAVMVTAFAVLALALAMVGIFGSLSYTVQAQMRDFGVRRALGATTGNVLGLVVRQSLGVVLSGTALGLVTAALLSRFIAAMLFGVQPADPATFAAVGIILAATAGLALAGPAWRAIRIDPVKALR
jgi:putative ABC transport system permease protein